MVSGAVIIPKNGRTAPIEITSAKDVITINTNKNTKLVFRLIENCCHKRKMLFFKSLLINTINHPTNYIQSSSKSIYSKTLKYRSTYFFIKYLKRTASSHSVFVPEL